MQLYMPVCDPAYLAQAAEIRATMADLMHRLSLRQNWEMLYSYQFMQIPEQAWFSHFLVDGIDVALWPASLPAGSSLPSGLKRGTKGIEEEETSGVGSVLISQRVLETPAGQKPDNIVLFAPNRHIQFCRWIYQSLGLRFTITSDLEEASKQVSSEKNNLPVLALSADRRAIERHTHRRAGFSICFVEPSLAASFRDLEKVLDRRARCADYVALNMLDPKTPQFAEQLENSGFGLGGVLPYHRNRHTLLYYRTASNFDWNSISQSSTLFDYLKNNDSKAVLNADSRLGKKTSLRTAQAV
jgi:hypothetical protein